MARRLIGELPTIPVRSADLVAADTVPISTPQLAVGSDVHQLDKLETKLVAAAIDDLLRDYLRD